MNKYETPVFEKQEEMTFPKDIIESQFNDRGYCLQCAACHGCK